MPLYDFNCKWCHTTIELYFVKSHDSLERQDCAVCQRPMKRVFPLPHVNVMNSSHSPGAENKWNWNPAKAFSSGRGQGAEYEHTRRELRTGKSRFDIGKHSHEWAHHLKGTKREMRRRRAANVP